MVQTSNGATLSKSKSGRFYLGSFYSFPSESGVLIICKSHRAFQAKTALAANGERLTNKLYEIHTKKQIERLAKSDRIYPAVEHSLKRFQ